MGWRWRVVLGALGTVCALSLAGLVVLLVWFRTYWIPTGAMSPTIVPDDRVLVRLDSNDLDQGDIVVIEGGSDTEQPTVKRIVAIGGDRVEISDGRLVVNGEPVDEPYLAPGTRTADVELTVVPPDSVYLLGDNRANSQDSRQFGPRPASDVVGKVVLTNPLPFHLILLVTGAASGITLLVIVLVRRSLPSTKLQPSAAHSAARESANEASPR